MEKRHGGKVLVKGHRLCGCLAPRNAFSVSPELSVSKNVGKCWGD